MKYFRYIFFTLVLFTYVLGQNNRATIQSGPIDYLDALPERPLCAVPTFSEEFISSHIQKMKNEYPEIYRKMQIPPKLNNSSEIGTVQKFWVLVDDGDGGRKSEEVEAELLAKGDYTAIWADKKQLSDSQNISKTLAERYVKLLEENTPESSIDPNKGVYPLELEYFGSPPNKDGDGIVDTFRNLNDVSSKLPQDSMITSYYTLLSILGLYFIYNCTFAFNRSFHSFY